MAPIEQWSNRPDLPTVRIDRTLCFEHPALIRAYAYWKARRGHRTMPTRADIDPVEMREFLPHVGLVDVLKPADAPVDYRIRLAGSHVESVFNGITGRLLSQFLEPAIEERWRYAFDLMIAEAAPLRFTARISYERKTWLISETLLAPLSDSGQGIGMLFGGFAAWSSGERPTSGNLP